ncbi:MAG: ImuA family protein [Rhizomicrobium sp.]
MPRPATIAAGYEEAHRHGRVPLGVAAADAVLGGGMIRGALHEVFAADAGHAVPACGFAAALALRLGSAKTLLWIRQDYAALEHGALSPMGLLELGQNPARLIELRVSSPLDALRAGCDGLSCKGLGAVVIEIVGNPRVLDLTATRRLTLAAAQSGVTPVLLREGADPAPSSAETRWIVRTAAWPRGAEDWGSPRFAASLVRHRHGNTGHWVMEWSCDEGIFGEASAGAVVPALSGGRIETAARIPDRSWRVA